MISPLDVATDGYLCDALSIAVNGYICKVEIDDVVPIPPDEGFAPGYGGTGQEYRKATEKDKKEDIKTRITVSVNVKGKEYKETLIINRIENLKVEDVNFDIIEDDTKPIITIKGVTIK